MTSALIRTTDPRASPSLKQRPSETTFSNSKPTLTRNLLLSRQVSCCRNGAVKYFNNMHSYSQLVLLSWGYTAEPPENYMDFVR